MNTIKGYVTEVLNKPVFHRVKELNKEYEYWSVRVKYKDIGGEHKKKLIFNTKREAKKVKEGYEFLH